MSRTILTSGLTFITVLSLFVFGGSVISDFALTLLIGIIVGTYSSIFIASPILLGFNPVLPEAADEDQGRERDHTLVRPAPWGSRRRFARSAAFGEFPKVTFRLFEL